MKSLEIVLLVAGRGSRLGSDAPKCLVTLSEGGQTILQRQMDALFPVATGYITAVVGYQGEKIHAAYPELKVVVNDRWAVTNTAKSLLMALEQIEQRDVLWLNGDVVFDAAIIPLLLASPCSCMAVNTAQCAEEEVKYTTGPDGMINAVSKEEGDGEGEAVGINLIKAGDLNLFRECLRQCADKDYFEMGLELALRQGLQLVPVDISAYACIEIDFPEDLARAQAMFAE